MKLSDCISCGNCQPFIEAGKCPKGALTMDKYRGYSTSVIDPKKCNNCGRCKREIDCLNDCFEDDESSKIVEEADGAA